MQRLSYDEFWQQLAPAYPVTKSCIRLPVVSDLLTIDGIDMPAVLDELQRLLEDLLQKRGTAKDAQARAVAADESRIVDLITDDVTGVVRFDCGVDTEGQVKVFEVNCDYPDGLLLHDHSYSVLNGSKSSLHHDLLESLFDEDDIAVVHDRDAVFLDAYYFERERFLASGKRVTIGGPDHHAPGAAIRRCVEVSKLTDADCTYFRETGGKFINSFALRTLGYKSLLENLAHPYIPQSMLLTPNQITRISAEKDSWVIKPVNGCEGHGVVIGAGTASDAWSSLVSDAATAGDYLAQEYVALSKLTVLLYDEGAIVERSLYYDLCPHFFVKNGVITGRGHVLMRFSESPIVNVSQGGGIGYYRLA